MYLGILPVAGKATRWGGYYKEFLPFGTFKYTVDFAIDAMSFIGVRDFLIITNPDKIQEHAKHFSRLKYSDLRFRFVLQKGNELIGAIETSLDYLDDYNFFAMPDTYIPLNTFSRALYLLKNRIPFTIGLFDTRTPERFGCLLGDSFVDKPKNLSTDISYKAWGTFAFTPNVKRETGSLDSFLNSNDTKIYYQMEDYYDFASFSDYIKFIERFGWDENSNTNKAL